MSPVNSLALANARVDAMPESTSTHTAPIRNVSILVISPEEEDQLSFRQIFSHSHWMFHSVGSLREAGMFLSRNQIPVVLSDRNLPDGTWKDVLHRLAQIRNPPRLIVACRHADDQLWREVIEFGAHDVLPKPLNPAELFRVVGLAWRHWQDGNRLVQ